jgi:hypothetical protein
MTFRHIHIHIHIGYLPYIYCSVYCTLGALPHTGTALPTSRKPVTITDVVDAFSVDRADVISPLLRKVRSESGSAKIGAWWLEIFIASVGVRKRPERGAPSTQDEEWDGFRMAGA